MTDSRSELLHYTSIASAMSILNSKSLYLFDCLKWDDKNDIHFMNEYKIRKTLYTLLSVCFSKAQQTYHHWRIFSGGRDGVCITFNREQLLQRIPGNNFTAGDMEYYTIKALKLKAPLSILSLPFYKRTQYEAEDEYRIIYENQNAKFDSINIPIEVNDIKRITLSPWLESNLKIPIVDELKSIEGCENLRINRSTLLDNENWKRLTRAK